MSASFISTPHDTAPSGSAQLDRLDLSALAAGAARLRPERIAFSDWTAQGARNISFGEFDARAHAIAQRWREFGVQAGERVLFAGLASSASIIAMLGALRAGIDVVVCGPHLEREALMAFARDSGVCAMAGEAHPALASFCDDLLHCAAANEKIRLLACIGETPLDGAIALDPYAAEHLPQSGAREGASAQGATSPMHARVITRDIAGRLVVHHQRTLVAAALDFVSRAQIGTRLPLVSTIYPSSFAGLIAGPVAALSAGAPLVLHAPFDARRLTGTIETLKPVHLIAPAIIAEELFDAGLVASGKLASLVLLTRFSNFPADMPKEPPRRTGGEGVSVLDLYAIGESAALAEARGAEGHRTSPLAEPHILAFDGRELVAARRKLHYLARNGKLDTAFSIEGLAVSPVAGEINDAE